MVALSVAAWYQVALVAPMKWWVLWDYREALWQGFLMTVQITIVAAIGAFAIGVWLACLRQLSLGLVNPWISAYVDFMRNLPAVVKVFFLYFVLGWDSWTAAVVGLAVHQSAYICDAVDSGFRSIPREQTEAAWALGHRRSDIFRFVLLPQAWAVSIPAITTQLIEVLKNSSVAMLISVQEMTFQVQQVETDTFRGFEAATFVTAAYVALAFLVAWGASRLERRFDLK